MPGGAQTLGPHSRAFARGAVGASLDGRSKAARFLRMVERTLAEHVGGAPSAAQRMLISRAALLSLQLHAMDEAALAAGEMSEGNSRRYLAWSNTLTRCLASLGLKGAAAKPPSLADLAAELRRPKPQAPLP
jgi:hypothetical protein